ncbi:Lin1244/Lin1753 domain-containing protein [Megasphaera vaginalis (ex Srinivasan et al. 2021)]|nr:Lin1244/Lin1753 domain-containing protein [Megasphaera vaginalis (ex Srinivasan et al. 2021)]
MSRPTKQGLDYFPLDVTFFQDIKIRRITRACGATAVPILISLLANIYRGDGYFLRWDKDMPFLISDEVGVTEGAVLETINKAVKVGFFDTRLYEEKQVLTSAGIQRRFFEATARRKCVYYEESLLLVEVNAYINLVNVNNNEVNVCNNSKNVDNNQQRKVKESKGKESKEEKRKKFAGARLQNSLIPVIQHYQTNIRPIANQVEKDKLSAMVDDFGSEAVIKAIDRAVLRNKRSLAYIQGILQRWEADGYDAPGQQYKVNTPDPERMKDIENIPF